MLGERRRETIGSVRTFDHPVPVPAQIPGHHFQNGRIVVDDQDRARSACRVGS